MNRKSRTVRSRLKPRRWSFSVCSRERWPGERSPHRLVVVFTRAGSPRCERWPRDDTTRHSAGSSTSPTAGPGLAEVEYSLGGLCEPASDASIRHSTAWGGFRAARPRPRVPRSTAHASLWITAGSPSPRRAWLRC